MKLSIITKYEIYTKTIDLLDALIGGIFWLFLDLFVFLIQFGTITISPSKNCLHVGTVIKIFAVLTEIVDTSAPALFCWDLSLFGTKNQAN